MLATQHLLCQTPKPNPCCWSWDACLPRSPLRSTWSITHYVFDPHTVAEWSLLPTVPGA
jgi:hypothetical protein